MGVSDFTQKAVPTILKSTRGPRVRVSCAKHEIICRGRSWTTEERGVEKGGKGMHVRRVDARQFPPEREKSMDSSKKTAKSSLRMSFELVVGLEWIGFG